VAGRSTESTHGYADRDRDEADHQTREIRHQIEETRDEMSETIDAIQEKLNPRNIVANATDRVKTAATERVREMADTASQTAQQAMDYTRERASGIAGVARQNPIPLALIGIGTAWLLAKRSGQTVRYDRGRYDPGRDGWDERAGRGVTERLTDSAARVAARTQEYASETADSVGRMARQRRNQLQCMLEQNPLLVGAGALMLGAAFGLAVPETDAENELMGETRDNLVDRARETARDAASQVQEAASSVADAARKLTGKPQS
jgi:gas vesicle protein